MLSAAELKRITCICQSKRKAGRLNPQLGPPTQDRRPDFVGIFAEAEAEETHSPGKSEGQETG
jgi:hypothetical protein